MPAIEPASRASRALDDLYRSHAAEVYRYAYAVLANHADAEDVTQTTFVNALRALERGDHPRKPSNWLITIAHNIVRQRFRQQQARPSEVELDRDVAVEERDEDGPTLDNLLRALQRIPASQREALVMRELEGRPYREIAEILTLSQAALETLLFRARRSLAEELENLVACDQAGVALSKRLDGRLSRKEKRRLEQHLRDCSSCARLDASQEKHRRAFGALAVLPLPLSLMFFKGTPNASAATGVPTIGLGATGAASGSSASTAGGLAGGGMLAKAAAVALAGAIAGCVGYTGVTLVRDEAPPAAILAVPSPPEVRDPATDRPPVAAPPSSRPALRPALRAQRSRPSQEGIRPASPTAPTTTPASTKAPTAVQEQPAAGEPPLSMSAGYAPPGPEGTVKTRTAAKTPAVLTKPPKPKRIRKHHERKPLPVQAAQPAQENRARHDPTSSPEPEPTTRAEPRNAPPALPNGGGRGHGKDGHHAPSPP